MIFSRLFKRKKDTDKYERLAEENQYVALEEDVDTKSHVVDMCEEIIDVAREYEDSRAEYELVTSYLNDIQIIEDLDEEEKNKIVAIAMNVSKLNKARDEFLKTEHKLSDNQFAQMQELENEIPNKIKRLKSNEEYLDKVKRDMKYLEGEKTSWKINREDCILQQKRLRNISIMLMAFFVLAAVAIFVTSRLLDIDTRLFMVIVAFFAALIGTYVFWKYQDYSNEIKKCDVNWNHVVSLENHVKIKYVNIRNAVDYTCEQFHVRNAYELNYNYEQYMDMIREREKFRRTNSDLERYNNQLIAALHENNLYDSRVWINHSNALIEKNEMVELKHDLLVRRQKLRARMEFNIESMTELRSSILIHKNELGDKVEAVNRILNRISQINSADL